MQAGPLNQRITLQAKVVSRDVYGAEVVGWSDVATVPAAVEPLSGRAYVAMRQAQSDVTTRFAIRWRAGVSNSNRVVWRGQPYVIIHVLDRDTKRDGLELLGYADAVPT